MNNQRNLLLAILLCGLLLVGWDTGLRYFYPDYGKPAAAQQTTDAAEPKSPDDGPAIPKANSRNREGGLVDAAAIAKENAELKAELVSAERIVIEAPEIAGTINPVGARIDDITLKTHRQAEDKASGNVRIFSPAGTEAQHYAQFGWAGEGVKLPTVNSVWKADGKVLSPKTPVTLTWDNGEGAVFTTKFAIDEHYMITAQQSVANASAAPFVAHVRNGIVRTSNTSSADSYNVHSGPISAAGEGVNFDPNYDDLIEDPAKGKPEGETYWLGFTDIFWLSALIPDNGAKVNAEFRSLGNHNFAARLDYSDTTIAPGKMIARSTRLFVGAKEKAVLDQYEAGGVAKFGNAIDWGWFGWLAKPIWWLLTHLANWAGNFGVAIIAMTLLIRLALFPIAQKQFASMAAMRAIQPKMKAIQDRYKDDKQKQQQEIMELYKTEKVNPLAGCLPMLIQIPIFFALYKTLMLAIEMRHQPFMLWIRDLSAPDPLHVFNMFGLLPFDVPSLLAIGPLAILLGISMWATFRLNPPVGDPIQQQMFAFMPWVLMFVMAPFAAGLLVYWITNNVLTLAQQTYLYSRHPQLRAQAEKDVADRKQLAERDEARRKKSKT